MLNIEKNIPIPDDGRHKLSEFTKTVLAMEVGDSFFIATNQAKANARAQSAKKAGMKFTTRKEGEGTRIWRVA